jgi:CelD/BcsL family acetyltransferase involved in cellulose biosynthesis
VRWTTLKMGDLTPQQIEAWHKIHEQETALRSPFTTYGFCHAVDKVRGNVFVSLLENRGGIQAIFPFERRYRLIPGVAQKPGGHLSDCFGMIGSAHHPLDEQELLERAGLSVFSFDHLPLQDNTLPVWQGTVSHGIRVEMPNFNNYVEDLRKTNKKFFKEVDRHRNQLVQQYGEMNFQWQTVRPNVELERLIDRKRSQYIKSGARDALKLPWARQLLLELLGAQHKNCEAILSTLYCGDTWVASNLALRTEQLLHIWFPVFNRDLRRFGPGHVLFFSLFESAATKGVSVVDFGGGVSAYKKKYLGKQYPLFKGCLRRVNLLSAAYRVAQSVSWKIRPLLSR